MGALLAFLPVLIFFVVVVSIVRAAAKVARKVNEQSPPLRPRLSDGYDPDVAERTRRIQEEIRRKIAERRGTPLPPVDVQPVGRRMEPPVIFAADADESPEQVSADQASAEQAVTNAGLVRQQQLANQMRSLETSRLTVQRRAAQIVADVKTESVSRTALLTEARAALLEDLKDGPSLRRAFVLREVLGPPVGMR